MSRALSVIRNPHALARMARRDAPPAADSDRLKPEWIDPVDPLETRDRARAQSLLCGLVYLDRSRNPGPLTLDQARDVLRWSASRTV